MDTRITRKASTPQVEYRSVVAKRPSMSGHSDRASLLPASFTLSSAIIGLSLLLFISSLVLLLICPSSPSTDDDGERISEGVFQRVARALTGSDPRLYEYSAYRKQAQRKKPKSEICLLVPSRGNCSSREFTRFYYDATIDHCFKFTYTGCNGNANRFLSAHQCRQRCSPSFRKLHAKTRISAFVRTEEHHDLQSITTLCAPAKSPQECVEDIGGRCVNGRCRCARGYEMKNLKCADSDECHWITCPAPHAKCVNLPGNFRCECPAGFAGSGFNCTQERAVCGQPFDRRYERQCYRPGEDGDSAGGWEKRFYYDADSDRCREFWYGGCQFGDNLNFFLTEETCRSICTNQSVEGRHDQLELSSVNGTRSSAMRPHSPLPDEICLDSFNHSLRLPCPLPTSHASKADYLNRQAQWQHRFFYDQTAERCRMFWYDLRCDYAQHTELRNAQRHQHPLRQHTISTSARSRNLFVHLSTCRRACEIASGSNTRGYVQAMFTLSAARGPQNVVGKDEYRLEVVTRASSKANEGPPMVLDKDEERPEYRLEIVTLPPPPTQRPYAVMDEERFYPDECLEPFDKGILTRHCSSGQPWRPRYYFDHRTRGCRLYWSGGCEPFSRSRNHFPDSVQCQWRCEGQMKRAPEHASCLDIFDDAYKRDCLGGSRYLRRFYFNHNSKQCEAFHYGGCQPSNATAPSRNMFTDHNECLQQCERPSRTLAKACHHQLDPVYRRPCDRPSSRGSLFTQYFYFDQHHGGCRAFWYGNCRSEGENIFATLADCQWLCERRGRNERTPAHCLERFDDTYRQSCNGGRSWRQRWFFDQPNGKCAPFWFDGCRSESMNIFESRTACENICRLPALFDNNTVADDERSRDVSAITRAPPPPLDAHLRCLAQPRVTGECKSPLMPAFSYNTERGQCEPFGYSGCGGNSNRFLTLAQCQSNCLHLAELAPKELDCLLPLDGGQGRSNASCLPNAGYRHYWSGDYARCEVFWYAGCGGNGNRFARHEECVNRCGSVTARMSYRYPIRVKKSGPSVADDEAGASISPSTCFQEIDAGESCEDPTMTKVIIDKDTDNANSSTAPNKARKTTMHGYSPISGQCTPFSYAGCGGNSNRFATNKECTEECGRLIPPISAQCAHEPDWGPCNHLRYQWHYNLTSGTCQQFLWGGCGGNENRFASFELCQLQCEKPTGEDVCMEMLDRGQWCEAMSNRYYYHKPSRNCKGFHYTGCGESRNNFLSKEECESICVYRTLKAPSLHADKRKERDFESGGGDAGLAEPKLKPQRTFRAMEAVEDESAMSYAGVKPKELPALLLPLVLNESSSRYMKSDTIRLHYGVCTGFRYNISGEFTRLNAYLCLMEGGEEMSGGGCEVYSIWETARDDRCRVVRPWLRDPHDYAWFFTVERRPWWRRPDGPPPERRPEWPPILPPVTPSPSPPPKQTPDETLASIIVLPVNDCHSVC